MSNKRIPIIIYSKEKARFITTHAVKTSGYGWCILAFGIKESDLFCDAIKQKEKGSVREYRWLCGGRAV